MALRDWLVNVTQSQSIRARILSDPYYRFQTLDELQLAASLGIQIDVNQAGVDDWLRLPGLSIHQARSLVELTQSGVHLHALEDIAAALGQPVQRLNPWKPVLVFCYYYEDSLHTIRPINVNMASVEALVRIPGVDTYLARTIVQNRSPHPYRNLTHLKQRLSLPSDTVAKLLHYLKF